MWRSIVVNVIAVVLANPPNQRSPLGSRPVVAPLESNALDILGPLPRSESGNKFVLVVCDLFTHWTEAIAIPDQLAETVAKAFVNDYISRFGVPLQTHTDRGTNFVSKLFAEMCKLLQMHHTWSGVHSTTGQTPNKMVFGRDIVLSLQAIGGLPPQDSSEMDVKPPDDFVTDLREQLEEVHILSRDSLKLKQQYRKRHYDFTAKSRSFKPGDAVWVYDTTRKPGVCKLERSLHCYEKD